MNSRIPINLAVEDDLSEAVLRKLLPAKYTVGVCYKKRGFGYLKKNIRGFNNAAKGMPFLVLTDLDREECPPKLIKEWLSVSTQHHNLLFRVAVREVESWVLADRDHFAKFLGIKKEQVPPKVDDIAHPKKCLIDLATKSRKRRLQEDIVPTRGSTAKQGPNYNGRLISFVEKVWNPNEAMHSSPSLRRAIKAVKKFQPKWEK
ncbi:MAG: DUF4276 family protein [Methanophagales archaeon]|nr:DUF4276 family protein [Methanophagales archaeon]